MVNALSFTIVGVDEGSQVFTKFARNVDKVAKDVDQSSGKFSAAGKKAGSGLGKSLLAGIGVGIGAKAVGLGLDLAQQFFSGMITEAREAQKTGAQTNAVLASTGNVAGISAAQVGKLAESISLKTGIDDEQIQAGENMLLTFTKVRNEAGKGNDVFNQATQVITDLSVATGKDMVGAATMVGKALNDPIRGVTALTKIGVTFNEGQREQIKSMVESGNVMGAQKVILGELTTEFGGSAAAQATAGDKIAVAFSNLQEQLGTALLPAIDSVANAFASKVIPAFSAGIDTVKEMATVFSGFSPPVKIAVTAIIGVAAAAAVAIPAFSAIQEKVEDVKIAYEALGRVGKISALAFGAVGVALVAGLSILGAYANEQRRAKEEVQSMKDALDSTTAALTAENRVMELNELRASGMTQRAKELGISYDDLVSANLGNADVQAKVNGILETYIALGESSAYRTGQVTAADLAHANAAKILQREIQLGNVKLTEAQRLKLEEIGVSKGAATATDKLAASQAESAKKAQEQADAIQALIDGLTKLTEGALDQSRAEINFQKAIDDATASVKENGKTLDVNTAKGQANKTNLDGIASATNDLIESKAKQGATEQDLQRVQDRGIVKFYQAALAMTGNKRAADKLTVAYFGIPGSRLTKLTADKRDADAKIRGLQASLKRTHDKRTIAKINADIKAAQAKRAKIQREIDSVRGKTAKITVRANMSPFYAALAAANLAVARSLIVRIGARRQHGGPVAAGLPYVVGEKGPELFYPGTSGSIMSNSRMRIQAGERSRHPWENKRGPKPFEGGSTTVVVQNSGVIGSERELRDWFVRTLNEVARTGRLPSQLRVA